MAFVFLNRYIDLADAIDDHSNEIVDNPYLAETDIPYEINLPDHKYLSVSSGFILNLFKLIKISNSFVWMKDEKHEEIKTRVITISMNRKEEPSLNIDERGMYEAALSSPNSDKKWLPCIITGDYLFKSFDSRTYR